MGTATHLTPAARRWLSPLPLWTGILAAPIAWAVNLTANYALVHWVCASGRYGLLQAMTAAALLVAGAGACVSWVALRHTAADTPTDGGHPSQRARFMAILGLTSSALFALTIVAAAIPYWVLNACQ